MSKEVFATFTLRVNFQLGEELFSTETNKKHFHSYDVLFNWQQMLKYIQNSYEEYLKKYANLAIMATTIRLIISLIYYKRKCIV